MLMDLVKCDWCAWTGLVERDQDVCTQCNTDGNLLDVRQDVEV